MEALNERALLAAMGRHYELVVAALQSHARLSEIEDEYQEKLSEHWDQAERAIRKLEAEIARLKQKPARKAKKKKPALTAKRKRKAVK